MEYRTILSRTVTRLAAIAAGLALLAACGTPGMVTMQTLGNGPVAVAALPTQPAAQPPTAAAADAAAPVAPAAAQPTQPAQPSAPDAKPTDFVALWVLFGTPTPTPNRGGNTGNTGNTGAGASTAVAAAPTTAPTTAPTKAPAAGGAPTLPPTATRAGGAAAAPTAAGPFKGDAARGKSLFMLSAGCNACHDTTVGVTIVGPSLKGVAARAATRKPGLTAIDYLRESIKQPNAYVVQGFAPGVMVQNYGVTLTAGQIDDLVAYLLTLK